MGAPTVYKWTDANAPIARGERHSLHDILYACLVTGYGDKTAAGWTREYANAELTKAVFRNNPINGSGFFLKVDGLSYASGTYLNYVTGFETMSDTDNGLNPFPSVFQAFSVSGTSDTTSHPWVLIADDRFFYLLCWSTTSSGTAEASLPAYVQSMAFGDCVSRHDDDGYCVGIAGMGNAAPYGSFGLLAPTTTSSGGTLGVWMPRNAAGAYGPISNALCPGGGPGASAGWAMGQYGVEYSSGGPLFITRPHLNDGASYGFRGYLPGMYYPCHPWQTFQNMSVISTDGKSFISFLTYVGGNTAYLANYFISLDDWWT